LRLLYLCLFEDAAKGARGEIVIGMASDGHAAQLDGMLILPVAALGDDEESSVSLDHSGYITYLHGNSQRLL